MGKLLVYLKEYKKEVILGPMFKLIEAIFELTIPLVMVRIIDIGVKNKDITYILQMGGLMVFLALAGFAASLTCQLYAARASQGYGTTLRNEIFKHINTFSHKEVDQFGTSTLITRITSDVNQLQLAVAMFIRLVVRAPFLVIGSVIMAMVIDLKLSIVFIVVTPVIFIILYLIMSKSIPYFKLIQKKLDKISLITRENLTGTRVIRAFSKQKDENKRFYEATDNHTNIAIKVGKISALLNPLTQLSINIAIVAIIWFGGIRVDLGEMTQGQVIAYISYMTQIILALVIVANLVVIFTRAAASASRVNEILEVEASIKDSNSIKSSQPKKDYKHKIEFKDVSFSYNNASEYAIKDANIIIDQGETIGIIGATGSGKSTIVNLIPRLYDVTKGEVLVDDKNVKDYNVKNLREKIAIVPQKSVLFKGTINENIRWGKENATEKEIENALKISQAWNFVDSLENKGNTFVSQGATNLSGGQKQRLTIARAIVMDPDILILDDSASALDFTTDAALRSSINKELHDRTIIIVSQRVSTIMGADKIIVLDKGNVVGIGSHEQLIKESELYREISFSQLGEEEVITDGKK